MKGQILCIGVLLSIAGLSGSVAYASGWWVRAIPQPLAELPGSQRTAQQSIQEPEQQSLEQQVSQPDSAIRSIPETEASQFEPIELPHEPLLPPLPSPELFLPEAPSFPTFNSHRLDQQLELYSRYLRSQGRPDVLIVGSSRALQGVDPVALQQALVEQGLDELKIYNFSINGATARVIDLVLRQVLTPEQLPNLIIWADGSRAFNNGRPDITYNGIVTSAGYRRLMTGDRPILFPVQPTETATSQLCLDVLVSPLTQIRRHAIEAGKDLDHPRSVETNDGSVQSQPSDRASSTDTSSMTISDLESTSLIPELNCWLPDVATGAIAEPGSSAAADPTQETSGELQSTGFQPILDRFDPVTYYQSHPRVTGQYDTNYIPFSLAGEQTAAATALARFAREQEIPFVFVNLPLSQEYLADGRQGYEQQFRQHMRQLSTREGFLFRDLSYPPLQNGDFADPSHLNRYGARTVSQQLASDPVIPWPQSAASRQIPDER